MAISKFMLAERYIIIVTMSPNIYFLSFVKRLITRYSIAVLVIMDMVSFLFLFLLMLLLPLDPGEGMVQNDAAVIVSFTADKFFSAHKKI